MNSVRSYGGMKGIGGHQKPNEGATDCWLTPPELLKALGAFDLDPCCPSRMPWRTAVTMYSPLDNGLMAPWFGRVWLNPSTKPLDRAKDFKEGKGREDVSTRHGRGPGRRNDPANYVESRNARTVWTIGTEPFKEAHFAVFPTEIPRRCILAGCPEYGVVLDIFGGSGTTGEVARELGRSAILIELNPNYIPMIRKRLLAVNPPLEFHEVPA